MCSVCRSSGRRALVVRCAPRYGLLPLSGRCVKRYGRCASSNPAAGVSGRRSPRIDPGEFSDPSRYSRGRVGYTEATATASPASVHVVTNPLPQLPLSSTSRRGTSPTSPRPLSRERRKGEPVEYKEVSGFGSELHGRMYGAPMAGARRDGSPGRASHGREVRGGVTTSRLAELAAADRGASAHQFLSYHTFEEKATGGYQGAALCSDGAGGCLTTGRSSPSSWMRPFAAAAWARCSLCVLCVRTRRCMKLLLHAYACACAVRPANCRWRRVARAWVVCRCYGMCGNRFTAPCWPSHLPVTATAVRVQTTVHRPVRVPSLQHYQQELPAPAAGRRHDGRSQAARLQLTLYPSHGY